MYSECGKELTNMLHKLVQTIRSFIKKILFRLKLIKMDLIWDLDCHSCFNLFPPSFYYTHTEEEVERITDEMQRKLLAYIEELKGSVEFKNGEEIF